MLNICMVGAGFISRKHINSFQILAAEGVRLAGICDLKPERAQQVASITGANAYQDYKEMINKEKPDALYICTPPYDRNHGLEALAAQNKIPTFFEKPIGLEWEEVERTAEIIDKSGIITSVGYQYRYFDIVPTMKKILHDKQGGLLLGRWIGYSYGEPWWPKRSKSGGQLHEQATHLVDLARYLMGEVVEVYAGANRVLLNDFPNIDIDDVTSVNLKFASGAVGNISCTCALSKPMDMQIGLEIFCRDLTMEIKRGSPDMTDYRLFVAEPGRSREVRSTVDPFLEEDRVFIESVKNGRNMGILSSYQDAINTFKITIAAFKSALSDKSVKIES